MSEKQKLPEFIYLYGKPEKNQAWIVYDNDKEYKGKAEFFKKLRNNLVGWKFYYNRYRTSIGANWEFGIIEPETGMTLRLHNEEALLRVIGNGFISNMVFEPLCFAYIDGKLTIDILSNNFEYVSKKENSKMMYIFKKKEKIDNYNSDISKYCEYLVRQVITHKRGCIQYSSNRHIDLTINGEDWQARVFLWNRRENIYCPPSFKVSEADPKWEHIKMKIVVEKNDFIDSISKFMLENVRWNIEDIESYLLKYKKLRRQ